LWPVFLSGLFFVALGVLIVLLRYKQKRGCSVQVKAIVREREVNINKEMEQLNPKLRKGMELFGIQMPDADAMLQMQRVVTYTARGVEYVKALSTTQDGRPKFSAGQRVIVCYDPSEPNRHYVVEEQKTVAILLVIFFAAGVFLMVLGYVYPIISTPGFKIFQDEDFGNMIAGLSIGLIMAGSGALWLWRGNKLKRACSAQVEGTVSHLEKRVSSSKGKQRTRYYPEFTYSVKGVEYIKHSSWGGGPEKFSVGQRVTIFYDPADPQRYYVKGESDGIAIQVMLIGFGVFFMTIALVKPYLQ